MQVVQLIASKRQSLIADDDGKGDFVAIEFGQPRDAVEFIAADFGFHTASITASYSSSTASATIRGVQAS